jgi:hypothetical protein
MLILRSSRIHPVPETFAPVPEIDRFVLFTEARERLGQAFVGSLAAAIPELSSALEDAAETSGSIVARRELFAAATVLRGEAGGRAQRGLGHLYDLTFRLLELNQSRAPDEDEPRLALLHDRELDLQILGDELSTAIRDILGPAYDIWNRRVDALTGTESIDARAPLGAHALSIAALESLRPAVVEHGMRPALRSAVLRSLGPRLADSMAQTDAWLAARGVHPRAPATPSIPAAEPEPVRPVARVLPIVPGPMPALPDASSFVPPPIAPTTRLPSGSDPEPEVEGEPETRVQPVTEIEAEAEAKAGIAADSSPELTSEPTSTSTPESEPQPEPQPEPEPEPEPEPTPVAAAIAASRPDPAEVAMERASQALVHSTRTSDLLGQQPLASGSQPETGFRHAGMLPRPEALEQDAVAFAHHVGVAPYSRLARQRFFESLRQRMLAARAPAAQLAALDLVGAMFEYVVDDVRTPEAAKPLLWRLQQPTATLAALDAGYLGDDRRSVRKLVENVAAISVAYADDVTKGSELYRRLDTVVRAVEVVSHAFQARSTVLGDQVRREYERAAQGVAQLVTRVAKERHALESTPGRRNRRDFNRRPSREREQEVTRRLESALRERIARCAVPESVREFLLGVWLRHLRTALLRDGEDSPTYRLAMNVVDDLLWTLDTTGPRQSRSQLASRIPPLIRVLTQGVTDIGARSDEFSAFLDELFVIHLRKMQKVPRDAETVPAQAFAAPAAASTGISAPSPDIVADLAPPTLDERLGDVPSTEAYSNESAAAPAPAADTARDALATPSESPADDADPIAGPSVAGAPDRLDHESTERPSGAEPDAVFPGAMTGIASTDAHAEAASQPAASAAPNGPVVGYTEVPRSADAVAPAPERTGSDNDLPKPAESTAPADEPLSDAVTAAAQDTRVVSSSTAPTSTELPPTGSSSTEPPPAESLALPSAEVVSLQSAPVPLATSTPIAPQAPPGALTQPASGTVTDGGKPADAPPTGAERPLNGIASHVDPGRREEVPAPAAPPAVPEDARSGEQRLLTVLSTLDLGDFPPNPQRLRLPPDDAIARLRRGDWLELLGRDGQPQEVKVAWINSRRTVVLLVRRPDRRALSLRASELHQRFAQHKAALIV